MTTQVQSNPMTRIDDTTNHPYEPNKGCQWTNHYDRRNKRVPPSLRSLLSYPTPHHLNDLNKATLHIDGQSTEVDAPPDIIDLDEDDDIIDDEDALPHDLADSDVEDIVNVKDDDGVEVVYSTDVSRGHGGDGGGDDHPPSHHIPTGCGGSFANRGKGTRKAIWVEKKGRTDYIPPGDPETGEMHLYYPSWQKVPAVRKAAIMTKIGVSYFIIMFIYLLVVRHIIRKISSWWNIDYSDVNSYEEWRVWLVSIRIQSNLKGIREGVYYGLWWYMWNFHNKLLFDKKIPEKALIFDNLVSTSFYWCKFRCKASFKWDDWLKNPYIVLV
ncbi:hypothetical protein Tco_0731619 [Tanacetum coccineum]